MHMETTTIKTTSTDRRAAVNGLAIVGFIVLIIIGMILAVYAARFVPKAISGVGSAAVYLSGQVFSSDEDTDGELVVVPPAETVPFGDETPAATSTPEAPAAPATPGSPAPAGGTSQPGAPVVTAVQVPASTNYRGDADLVVENVRTGYMTSSDSDTFRASNDVPDGERGAVRFAIANRGTNVSERFEFDFRINTSPSISETYKVNRELRPGERIEYTLWFDRVRGNDDRTITIEADSDKDVDESNERNNERTVRIDIED